MSKMEQLIRKLIDAVKVTSEPKTQPYDTPATVTRIDGDTVWVHMEGGTVETPIKKTINCRKGDTVQVRSSGGSAWLTGNMTAPPTDDRTANQANRVASDAQLAAARAIQNIEELNNTVIKNAENFTEQVLAINADIVDLQSQIDGNVTSWFYTVDPLLTNPPAVDWTTTEEKNNHLGDLYYNTDSGYVWRWIYQNNTWSWSRITDSDVQEALRIASAAQDTADNKRRVFVVTPIPPYDVGDLWCEGGNGNILTCTTAKTDSQAYASSDWTKLNKYTDDARANSAYNLASDANTAAGNAMTAASGKNTIYHQADQPSGGTYKNGDTWFDTDDGYKMYRYNGTTWVPEQFGRNSIADTAINAQKLADLAVSAQKLGDLAVTAQKINDNAVTTTKIADAAITNAKIGSAAITEAKIASAAITAAKISEAAVTEAKIANGAITNAKIGQAAITEAKIKDGAITTAKIDDAAITTAKIKDAAISSAKISALDVGKLTGGYIDASHINAGELSIGQNQVTDLVDDLADAAKTATSYIGIETDGIKVGKNIVSTTDYMLITGSGQDLVTKGVTLAHFGYATGKDSGGSTSSNKYPYYTFGTRQSDTASDRGNYSFAEGTAVAAKGYASHAEGIGTTASKAGAHAEGYNTTASGLYAHSEGQGSVAFGDYSHAENYGKAYGNYSHAEGDSTASGPVSHAQNQRTIAGYTAQTAIGKFNKNNSNNLLEIGNGTADNERSNAMIVDINGNVSAKGMAGMIQMFGGTTAPIGWLLCHGQEVSRTTYAELYSVIGTTFGAGNGYTTFNVPNMQGRFPLGIGTSTATGATTHDLNDMGGNENLIVPRHRHIATTYTSNELASGTARPRHYVSDGAGASKNYTSYEGEPATGANMPPFIGINFIIATGKTD